MEVESEKPTEKASAQKRSDMVQRQISKSGLARQNRD